ncbi:hypothetical protein [Tropicimonas sp. IMCC34043]|uniref:hypothetical protein n=1 Tax=Tropicimonas sp. IMCC34043 TaxID=2248760 RepID=UPI000E22CB98|nr:hypothetical protein [Tropicimonas sp. IMCC34043]
MSVTTTVRIGTDSVDINAPCDVVTALRKLQLRLGTGAVAQTVRLDDEEVTFNRADDARLAKMIAQYEDACARASGGRRRRYAMKVRFS